MRAKVPQRPEAHRLGAPSMRRPIARPTFRHELRAMLPGGRLAFRPEVPLACRLACQAFRLGTPRGLSRMLHPVARRAIFPEASHRMVRGRHAEPSRRLLRPRLRVRRPKVPGRLLVVTRYSSQRKRLLAGAPRTVTSTRASTSHLRERSPRFRGRRSGRSSRRRISRTTTFQISRRGGPAEPADTLGSFLDPAYITGLPWLTFTDVPCLRRKRAAPGRTRKPRSGGDLVVKPLWPRECKVVIAVVVRRHVAS